MQFFFFPFFPIFLFFKIRNFNHYSCINWDKGLNDTYIDNNSKDYPFLINIPKGHSCYLDEIGKYFLKSIQNYNIKYYNISKKNYFGYPITNNDKFNIKEFGTILSKDKKNLEEELHKNIILMDLYIKNKTK